MESLVPSAGVSCLLLIMLLGGLTRLREAPRLLPGGGIRGFRGVSLLPSERRVLRMIVLRERSSRCFVYWGSSVSLWFNVRDLGFNLNPVVVLQGSLRTSHHAGMWFPGTGLQNPKV